MFSIFCSLMILVPSVTVAITYQSEISRLTAEKQRKYAELEKCVKSVKGLTIAGVSTLGLTAGGVALNLSQADKSKTLDSQINATNKQIERKKQEIEEKRIKEEQERQAQAKMACETDAEKIYTNGRCIDKTLIQTPQTTVTTKTEIPQVQTETKITVNNDNPVATADSIIDVKSQERCKSYASKIHGTECYQDSDGKWKLRWIVKDGDPCPISECFDKTNTATCKYVWIPESFVCVADTCKTGYKVFGHMCQKENPITCDETKGEIVAPSGDKCIKQTTGLSDKSSDTQTLTMSQEKKEDKRTNSISSDKVEGFASEQSCRTQANIISDNGIECEYNSDSKKWDLVYTIHDGDVCSCDPSKMGQDNAQTCKYKKMMDYHFECIAATCKSGYKISQYMCEKELDY